MCIPSMLATVYHSMIRVNIAKWPMTVNQMNDYRRSEESEQHEPHTAAHN